MSDNFTVKFAGDYVTLQTHVEADDDEQAIDVAVKQILDYYGWDLGKFEAEAELESEF